jgi:hypothetical protein
VILNLSADAVIVLDNAPYHKVQNDRPSSFSSEKDIMKFWLYTRGIRYVEDSSKVRMFQLIKIDKLAFKVFSTDSLLARYGFFVCTRTAQN